MSDLYINGPKYIDLKEEVIESGDVSLEQFKEKILLKATKILDSNNAKKSKR